MRKLNLFFFLICVSTNNFGQNITNDQQFDLISHEVKVGESVRALSKKYLVDPAEIYRLNRFAIDGVSQGMVLQIPVLRSDISTPHEIVTNKSFQEESFQVVSKKNIEEKPLVKLLENNTEKAIVSVDNSSPINHVVGSKETIYGLSKKYNVAVDEIKLINQELLKEGLKIGQILRIPSKSILGKAESTPLIEQKNPENEIKHKVEAKETLYSLSKKYNVSVDEIKQQNELKLQKGLQIGQVLIIKRNN